MVVVVVLLLLLLLELKWQSGGELCCQRAAMGCASIRAGMVGENKARQNSSRLLIVSTSFCVG